MEFDVTPAQKELQHRARCGRSACSSWVSTPPTCCRRWRPTARTAGRSCG